jgi:P27 family predicted phage terminase small subunit
MAVAARKPKPIALRAIEGSKASHPPVPPETIPLPDVLQDTDCPEGLSTVGRQYWRRMAPILTKLGVLTEADKEHFQLLCEAYAEWMKVEEAVKKFMKTKPEFDGLMIPTVQGWKANPMLSERSRARMEFLKLGVEFGLTPSSRARVSSVKQNGKEKKKFNF